MKTHGKNILYGDPHYGVTATQVEKRLTYIYYSDLPDWWLGNLNFVGMSASISKQLRNKVAGGGVNGHWKSVASANEILNKYEFRIDVDNLSGHNLQRY